MINSPFPFLRKNRHVYKIGHFLKKFCFLQENELEKHIFSQGKSHSPAMELLPKRGKRGQATDIRSRHVSFCYLENSALSAPVALVCQTGLVRCDRTSQQSRMIPTDSESYQHMTRDINYK